MPIKPIRPEPKSQTAVGIGTTVEVNDVISPCINKREGLDVWDSNRVVVLA